jgi:RNA polymerase sigma-70 factor (ECF subfamily)
MRDAVPVSTALQAEDRAFESLYRLHRPLVYAYAFSKLRHAADAEDVTQTTFLNAYNALHRGVSPRDPIEWLLAITRNVCRDRFRDAKRRPQEQPLADWIRIVQPEEPDFSVREICKEISGLNPRHRQALLMREFEGRSYAEISAELGVSEAAVQTLLTRARRSLRDELELGMTCAHARRVAVRDLNGVAVFDERRALKRHLRRCAECATFVGQ